MIVRYYYPMEILLKIGAGAVISPHCGCKTTNDIMMESFKIDTPRLGFMSIT